jgi:nitrite reductase/ring-hydroxylating ferredoxin subunit
MPMRMVLPSSALRRSPKHRHSAGHNDPTEVRRLTAQASGNEVLAGSLSEVFGRAGRAVIRVERDGKPIDELLLFRRGARVVALVNRCPHLQRALDDARVHGRTLVCLGHGRLYSLCGPSPALRILPTRSDGATLLIDISELSG